MKEQLISFETAKLAKEKGFDIECKYFYNAGSGWKSQSDSLIRTGKDEFIERPSQANLQLWLRETRDIHVQLYIHIWSDRTYAYRIHASEHYIPSSGGYFMSDDIVVGKYEYVLEEGLKRALNLIK